MREETTRRGTAVTVGTFDGVHRGHETVLEMLGSLARERDLEALAVTFDRHPLETICPERAPKLLMDPDCRDMLIRLHGVRAERVEFDEAVRRMTCAEWMRRLVESEGMRLLVLGYDNTFGSDGLDLSVDDYRRIGRELGVDVHVAPMIDGCSSSAARRAVAEGDMARAAFILGRPFSIRAGVTRGRQIGRTIGIPTANLLPAANRLLPAAGVYAAAAVMPNGRRLPAVANVGSNPTVAPDGSLEKHIEVHVIGFNGDLYDEKITVEFLRRLRDEMKFDSLADLQRAIRKDIDDTLAEPLQPISPSTQNFICG